MESGCIWGSTGTDFLYKNDIPPPPVMSLVLLHTVMIFISEIFSSRQSSMESSGMVTVLKWRFNLQCKTLNWTLVLYTDVQFIAWIETGEKKNWKHCPRLCKIWQQKKRQGPIDMKREKIKTVVGIKLIFPI